MAEKKKMRFTAIDAVIILVIVAVCAFVGIKFFGPGSQTDEVPQDTFSVSYYFEEIPSYTAEAVKIGDSVTDESTKTPLGKVVDIEVADSVSYASDSQGNFHKSSKEGYNSMKLTAEVKASEFEHGISVSDIKYVVGHSITLYAGKAKIFGRVCAIEKK